MRATILGFVIGATVVVSAWALPQTLAETRSAATVPDVAYGARVRIMSPRLGEGWHSGVVGRVGSCLAVMVPQQDGDRVTGFSAIRFEHITRLRLSGRYDGRPSRPSGRPAEYRAGMDTIGEPWSELAIAPLRQRHGGCTPF